jgi:hypothetical protein
MREGAAIALALLFLLPACAPKAETEPDLALPSIDRIVILQLERAAVTSEPELPASRESNPNPRLADGAEAAVTAQLYGVLANDPNWRLVPDIEVDDAMREVPLSGGIEARAQALGAATKSDAVVTGRVSRFQERLGSAYGARFPASVSFELELVHTSTGKVLWHGTFDQTQDALSFNLFDFWMFWEAGPRWFSAGELAGLGVQKLIGEMDESLKP